MNSHIYRLDENVLEFEGLNFVDDDLWTALRIGGVKALATLVGPIPVELNTDSVSKQRARLSDLVLLETGLCCLRSAAWSAAASALVVRGPIAKLIYDGAKGAEEFVLFEPERKFDCLDFTRSRVTYFSSSGRVSWVDGIVLKNAHAIDEDIFTVEHMSWTLFCTGKCKSLVKAHRLTGFQFEPIPLSGD